VKDPVELLTEAVELAKRLVVEGRAEEVVVMTAAERKGREEKREVSSRFEFEDFLS